MLNTFPPEVREHMKRTFESLHRIVNMPMSRDQAIEVRSSVSMCVGIVVSRNGLKAYNKQLRTVKQQNHHHHSDE